MKSSRLNAKQLSNVWENLGRFLEDGRLEIDNNLVENSIRPVKLGAKNWLFLGSKDAGKRAAILFTIVENCRRHGLDVHRYLTDALERLPHMKEADSWQLTPANWQASQEGHPLSKPGQGLQLQSGHVV